MNETKYVQIIDKGRFFSENKKDDKLYHKYELIFDVYGIQTLIDQKQTSKIIDEILNYFKNKIF